MIILCGGSSVLEPRSECPSTLHDWPLPDGYVDAHEAAKSRLARQWKQAKCKDCKRYGWIPGRLGELDKEVRHESATA